MAVLKYRKGSITYCYSIVNNNIDGSRYIKGKSGILVDLLPKKDTYYLKLSYRNYKTYVKAISPTIRTLKNYYGLTTVAYSYRRAVVYYSGSTVLATNIFWTDIGVNKKTVTLSSVSKNNYTLLGYSTSSTSNSVSYKAGDLYTLSAVTTNFYAIWQKNNKDLSVDSVTTTGNMSSGTGYHTYTMNYSFSLTASDGINAATYKYYAAITNANGVSYSASIDTKTGSVSSGEFPIYNLSITANGGSTSSAMTVAFYIYQTNYVNSDGTITEKLVYSRSDTTGSNWYTASTNSGGSNNSGSGTTNPGTEE